MWGCKQQIAFHQKPLLLYLASSPLAIRALIAHEDGGGIDQPVYYISHTLKDAEMCYQKAKKKVCLAIVYATQRLQDAPYD